MNLQIGDHDVKLVREDGEVVAYVDGQIEVDYWWRVISDLSQEAGAEYPEERILIALVERFL